jgi:FkbM family methyltransferase
MITTPQTGRMLQRLLMQFRGFLPDVLQLPTLLSHYKSSKMYAFLTALIHPDSLVFDIGANVGGMTNTYLNMGAKVVAVEPVPEFAAKLRKNYPKATVIEKAIGAHYQPTIPFHISGTLSTVVPEIWWTGRFSHIKKQRTISVEMTTLSALIKEYGVPDYIKIDCEGYDLQVIYGLDVVVPSLSFEYIQEQHSRAVDAVSHLSDLGFKRFNLMWGQMHPYLPDYSDADTLLTALKTARKDIWGDLVALQ